MFLKFTNTNNKILKYTQKTKLKIRTILLETDNRERIARIKLSSTTPMK